MAAMPNLRSVSVSPWADFDKVAEMLGRDYVYSRKPDPVPISGPTPHWERAEADLRRTYEATRRRQRRSCSSATSTTSAATAPGSPAGCELARSVFDM